VVTRVLEPYRGRIEGIVVESTPNWYWLVDGLAEQGYRMHLAHPAGNRPYKGLKYSDDRHDAKWLGELLRLGILREGHILEPGKRAVRDLLRKRGHLVRERTRHLLSLGNLMQRNTGRSVRGDRLREIEREQLEGWGLYEEQILAMEASLEVLGCLDKQIGILEREVKARVKGGDEIRRLVLVPGIGRILGWTVLLETGPVERFSGAGHYASYCRCVRSVRLSAGKKKGQGNRRNGNPYLAWALGEAAHHAVCHYGPIRRWYQRRKARSHPMSAKKAVASKLAKACYYILRDGVAFEMEKAF
jgi:transposase